MVVNFGPKVRLISVYAGGRIISDRFHPQPILLLTTSRSHRVVMGSELGLDTLALHFLISQGVRALRTRCSGLSEVSTV